MELVILWIKSCNTTQHNTTQHNTTQQHITKIIKIRGIEEIEKYIDNILKQIKEAQKSKYHFIFCIGGSSTYGVFTDEYHTYPYILNTFINDAIQDSLKTKYIVFNLGMPGTSSDGYWQALEKALNKINPELVIFYTGYNDIFIKSVNQVYGSFSANLFFLHQAIERYSLLIMTATEKYLISKHNKGEIDWKKYRKLEEEFAINISNHIKKLHEKEIKVLLIPEVLIAKNFGNPLNNYEDYKEKYRNIPNILKEIAVKNDCEYLDIQGYFDNENFKQYFVDPVHLTDAGNKVLSSLIFENSKIIKEFIKQKGGELKNAESSK